jgi:hypothetical protein
LKYLFLEKLLAFACRRHYQDSNTYINFKTKNYFCDSKVTNSKINKKCPQCNLNLTSSHCEKLHRSLCYGVGHFGWYCDKCCHFTYKTENLRSEQIKAMHECGVTICRLLSKAFFESDSNNIHLCPLRLEKPTSVWPHLAFFWIYNFWTIMWKTVPYVLR